MATLSNSSTNNAGSDFGAGSGSSSSSGFDWGNISGEILTKFLLVLEAALILLAAYLITLWIRRRFEKMEAAHDQQRTALNLLEKITSGFTIVIGLTLALKTVGLDISLLVSVGLLGLSYGMKDVMKNYVAGILIFFKAPFKIGDIVRIKQFTGTVEKMDLQSISLRTFDAKDVTIYNADIMAQSVTNFSHYPMRRLEIVVRLGYGSNMNRALHIFNKLLISESRILTNPKSSIMIKKFADTGIDVLVRFWVQMPANINAIRSSFCLQIQQAFDEAFIFIPTSRAIENENDRFANENTKTKIKEFYDSPLLADLNNPPQPAATTELAPEVIDIEAYEPTDEF
ncbi:MAG: mechanosensitive ion channel family protein [Candidatus Gracilibacteria bacterium]